MRKHVVIVLKIDRQPARDGEQAGRFRDAMIELEAAGAAPASLRAEIARLVDRAVAFAAEGAANPRHEKHARVASNALYNAAGAALMAWEGSATGSAGGDARRMFLARMVVDHRLRPQDPIGVPGSDWEEEAIAVLLHKKNVYLDCSGWRPKYIPAPLKHEMNRRLQDKIMFGSDYPGWSPGQCLDELEMEGLRPGVAEKLFFKNAIRVLKLENSLARAEQAAKARVSRG